MSPKFCGRSGLIRLNSIRELMYMSFGPAEVKASVGPDIIGEYAIYYLKDDRMRNARLILNMPKKINERPSHSHTTSAPAIGEERNVTPTHIVATSKRTDHMIHHTEADDMAMDSHNELMAAMMIKTPITNTNVLTTAISGRASNQPPANISSMASARLHPHPGVCRDEEMA